MSNFIRNTFKISKFAIINILTMSLNTLTAISPVDGRYNKTTRVLQKYFSESALIKYRVHVEIEYFIALCNSEIIQLQEFPKENLKF